MSTQSLQNSNANVTTPSEPELWFRNLGAGTLQPELLIDRRQAVWKFRPIDASDFTPFTNAFNMSGINRCIQLDDLASKNDVTFLELEMALRSSPHDDFVEVVESLSAAADRASQLHCAA